MSVEETPARTREAYLLPTSFGQRRLWFLDLLEPDSSASYVEHGALRIRGELDVPALQRALDTLVARHETLRTGLVLVDSEPVQAVSTSLTVAIERIDVADLVPPGLPTDEVHQRLAGRIRKLLRRRIEVTRPPLFRATLLDIADGDRVLLVAFHHAVYDQWSGAVFVRELLTAYDAALAGVEPALPELPIQYGDFAAWQREWVGGEEEDGQLGYWADRLAGLPPLELPTDRPRPATQTFDGATVTEAFPAGLVADLEHLGRDHQATLFMTVLAGFATVLARHSGQDDLAIGTPVAGRRAAEVEHLIGFFVNNLPLRVDAGADPSFAELLDRVRATCLDGYANADVPFERVVERVRPDRDLARSPLFSVMFVFGNVPLPALTASGITAELFRVDPGTAKFDLFVTCVPRADGGLNVTVEYNTALFDPATAQRLLAHLRMVLDGAVADPHRPISALPLLTETEREQLTTWGRGASRPVPARTLPELVAAHADADTDRTAVTGVSGRLSYGELVGRARRIATALRAAGVTPGQLVGVAVGRDVDLPATLLGVLGAGAAYLPIDVALPVDRVRFVLADSGATLVLADATTADALPAGTPLLRVDADLPAADGTGRAHPDADLPAAGDWPATPAADDIAYVIYTSGSTGTPKGVAVPHGALLNLLATMAERPGLGRDDVLAALTTLSFDIAALELFGPLLAGGRVDVVPREVAGDGTRLAAHLSEVGATVAQATPGTWKLLLAAGWRPAPGFAVWCGGEVFPPELAHTLAGTGAAVWNLYGPTETTVWSTVYRVVGGEGSLPLGVPVANTELLVVDAGGRRVPVGVPGELWIGGAGVAAGYWRREELTAERFVGHPEVSGARVYRTGDVVRWRADGGLEFLGRVDFQVKVRGHRIELGEIESVLRGHPGVRDAVVVVREDRPGDQRLVAYHVGGPVSDDDLRAACRDRLPEYMVPAVFVPLAALPLTPNGKIDRRALPAPDPARREGTYVAPRGPVEETVAGIFADVLGVDRVGRDDDFFTLGGHSLLATGVIGRIAATLGVDLPVRTVFARPTVAGLAAALPGASPADTRPTDASPVGGSAPAVRRGVRHPEADGTIRFPASFQQRRVWFLTEFEPATATAYHLYGALRLRGPLDVPALHRAVALLVERHESLRTGFAAVDGEPVQVVHPHVPTPLTEVDLRAAGDPEAALAELLRAEAVGPFDLAVPPLLRITLAICGPDDAALLVTLHHAVGDRLAVEALTTELSTAYTALAAGNEPTLPDLPVQYGDYADAQQEWAGGPAEERQLDFWRTQLADVPVLDLPTDRARPAVLTHRGATRQAELPAELVDRLTGLAAARGGTLFMALLAGYALTLSRYCRTEDVPVGSPISGRYRPELEPLIGYFTNNLVLRTDLGGDPTVGELVDRVRAVCLDAYAHADVPFERLVERLRPERDLAHSPLFQVMFIAAHLPAPSLRLGALTATPLRAPETTAKYDLTFTVFPTGPESTAQRVVAEYNTDLFDADTVDRLLAHYRMVLTAFADGVDRPLSTLPALPPEERARLTRWGTGTRPQIPETSVDRYVSAGFARHADRIAVADDTTRLSYAELDARAHQLAHHLRALGVGRGDKVALLAERSCEVLVALLGVLRAGAAYVPIDKDFPADRIAFILDDSGATAVLTQENLVGLLPQPLPGAVRVLRLDTDWSAVAQRPVDPLPDGPGQDDLAYVIYTSGSTGRPKGVLLPHRPVVNFLLTMAERPGMPTDAVVGAANTISCDMPVLDVYLPLVAGARIEMIPHDTVVDGERLAERLARSGVTYLQGTPTTWRLLQQAGWRPPAGFTALAGAEKVPTDLAHWLHDLGATVWHLYGPTETTVWSTVYRVVGGEGSLPLGVPVANTELLVVDAGGRRVPVGVPGELWIGGAGVAAGYWRREELTAERFVGHPEVSGARVYRTGDVVRWRADGGLEFLGRVDFQVKVRGHRIELGEIESVLRGHPGVRDAVVVVREDRPGDQRLVGYADLHDPDGADRVALTHELHAACRDRLPDYMVPAALVLLDALPLTANRNKVDRAKLPAPDGLRPDIGTYVEPRGPVEQTVAGIFADVLTLDRVGRDDDFFALGGHSLLATRLVARVRDALATDLPVRTVFARPTVAALAAALPQPARTGSDPAPEQAAGPTPVELPPIAAQFRMPQVGGDLSGRWVLPASSGQRRLWFLDQLDPGSAGAYAVDSAVRLTGPLDPDALHRALNAVVARHETLRTSFHEADGEPVQVVAPALVVPLDRVEAADADTLAETLDGLSGRPFDLTVAPLLRATLIRLTHREHVLHLALHHAICDRWSVQILARDLVAAYVAGADPTAAGLPGLPVQYGDYAAWQRQWTAGEGATAQVEHWRERLADLPTLDLPTDRPRPVSRAYTGDLRWDRIPADLVARATEAGRRRSATLFMVGLAACQLLLGRYSGQTDFAVGSPVAGRPRTELEGLVGFFVNNLVLRADLTGDPTVGELLDRVRDTCLDAYAHADVPFDLLVERLRPVRDRAQTPLFNVLFAVQNTPAAARAMGEAVVTPVDLRPGTAQFDLSIMLVPDDDGLRLRVEYDRELFDPATVDRMIAQYRLILADLSGDPGRRLGELAPLTEDERRLLLDEWVRTTPQPETPGLLTRFREQAARTPDAVAAECGNDRIGYAELRDRAADLAGRLHAAGVARGDRVGIHLDRSLDLLVAVLGVLDAGAAYVPLDPAWPAERMRYVLDDAGVTALVADADLAGFTGPVVAPTTFAPVATAADRAPEDPDDVAYLIYTSGSTGRPKGVMVTHRNVVRLVTGAATLFRLGPDDVWSMFHPVAFDVSVFELWGAWLTGGRVVVVPYLASREPAELRALLARHRVTVLSQTPTAFRQLTTVEATAADRLAALRYVVFAGEPLEVRALAGWFDRYGDDQPELVNMYGTTETTVHATFHRVRATELAEPNRNRVGRPLPDLRILLLDPALRPVPLGGPGEVAIGGPGVSLGYAGRPELTAERFVTDPHTGERLYRTGDRARWLPDGTLDFLGRTDTQVKIRGFRVEPGEVEAVLREHPEVADAVVVARAGRADDTELAGYVVPRPDAAPTSAALREHARRLLPEYLVPATLTVLAELPRTGNGKLDVRALPEPTRAGDDSQTDTVAPRDDLERTLADIWREVLGVDRLGVHDNFFDLGGHSLLATRAMSRTRAALGVDTGVRALFDLPTVAALAGLLRTDEGGSTAAIPVLPRDGVLPVSPAQRRLWLLHQLDPTSGGAYVIGTAVRLRGPLDVDGFRAAFAEVVARHEPLRTRFDVRDGEPVQVVLPELTVPVELLDARPDEVAALTRDRLTAPFDLGTAPLVRVTLLRVDDEEHHLLLALDHTIGDQGSTQVLVRDLVTAYRARVAGEPVDLPAPALQYADVAAWQRDRLERGEHDEELRHWVDRLAGLPVLDLPTDRVRPATRTNRGGQRYAEVPAGVVDRLTGVARRYDATGFMVALAAYQLMLGRYAGQSDFGVAVPVSGRDRPETETLVGFLANTLVLRADLAGDPSVAELIGRVRRACLAAYAHAEVPFDVLVERLGITRDLSRTPLAQVGFALVDRVDAADRRFAGITAEPLEVDPGTAKTDLTVTVVPTDGGAWRLVAEYATDLFTPATVDRMVAHLVMLLTEIATDPERAVAALPELPAAEAAQLAEWGRGPVADLPTETWPELFARQVAATPDHPAVIFGDESVSYAELNGRANRLAHRLVDLGVAPDALVGIVADRSVEMVVAVLAVLKAGGAYVPVDPSYPADRVAFMISDSRARVLLAPTALRERIDAPATVVAIDDPDLAGLPDTDPPVRCRPEHLAYVIYTSGSTGTPKGVAVEHRSVANLHLTRHLAGLHDGSRVLQFAPFSFDVSVFEMVLSLLGGVPLVVPAPADLAGGVEIVQLINRQRVTFTFIPPSLLAHLAPEHVPTLEVLGSGGEDCPADVAERWGGKKRFLIGYGPTETTVYATVTDEIVGGGHPPIGRPVTNTVVRVLDERLRSRPLGAPGELFIGGAGLARGYLHRPELTEAAFVTHPVTGERLYRTGDLVRYLPDGNLEFLGRTDDQVKLRGFRIELGEIAAALRAHPGVAEAVAVVREDRPGDKKLVGYVVPADGTAGDDALLRAARDAVGERLPQYMVPAAVVALPALPLTPNGKVDRRALPAPTGTVADTGYVPPRTATERQLTRLVAEALGVERVGLDDDFFALGGHSLLAARLHATIRRLWNVDLPVRVLFERSRIGALADLLDAQGTVDVAAAEAEHVAALRADVVLPEEIRPVGEVRFTERPGTVLLTGATGFLGAFLARHLAEQGATVLCLVRGRDDTDAQRRLETQLRRYHCWDEASADRVRAVTGDLEAPRLGLTERRFADLAREVDAIHHCGAVVHFLRPYAMLRDGNVRGTVEILRLATLDRPIPVHYVSTMSVFGGLTPEGPVEEAVLREDVLPDVPPPVTDTGYNHSKWVAEQVVALARARGLPIAVYRPGRIAGDTRSGVWRRDDLVCQVIRACVRTGLVPDTGLATDLVPVDHIAEVITGLSRRRAALGRTFHFALAEKVPLVRLADALTDRGWPVRRVPLAQWYAAVTAAAEAGDAELGPVLAMYAPLAEGRVSGPGEPVFDDRATREVLGDGLRPPRVDTDLLGRYLDGLVAEGFLPAPPTTDQAEGDQR